MRTIALIPPSNTNIDPEKWKKTRIHKAIGGYNEETDTYWGIISEFEDWEKVDFFIFMNYYYDFSTGYLRKLNKLGLRDRIIYWMSEPEVVLFYNSAKYLSRIRRFTDCIITWNKDLVDNKYVFQNYFYVWEYSGTVFPEYIENTGFENKKLLCSISSNKYSNGSDELYSARREVIDWFEHNHSDDFDFYGYGWNSGKYKNYKGEVDNKDEIYGKYKFAIAFENMKNVSGYVTEKIIDCLKFGIVPVYYGTSDITDYIPQDCFIDYAQFDDMAQMYDYLTNMGENEYFKYVAARNKWIKDKRYNFFTYQAWANRIVNILPQISRGKKRASLFDMAGLLFFDYYAKTRDFIFYHSIKNK